MDVFLHPFGRRSHFQQIQKLKDVTACFALAAAAKDNHLIVGLGSDLVEIGQVRRELDRGAWRANDGVFTPAEIAWCGAGRRPELRFAACFAAKEAALKALGVAVRNLGEFRKVELSFARLREGEIILQGDLLAIATQLEARQIKVSIAHAKRIVGAMVILQS